MSEWHNDDATRRAWYGHGTLGPEPWTWWPGPIIAEPGPLAGLSREGLSAALAAVDADNARLRQKLDLMSGLQQRADAQEKELAGERDQRRKVELQWRKDWQERDVADGRLAAALSSMGMSVERRAATGVIVGFQRWHSIAANPKRTRKGDVSFVDLTKEAGDAK